MLNLIVKSDLMTSCDETIHFLSLRVTTVNLVLSDILFLFGQKPFWDVYVYQRISSISFDQHTMCRTPHDLLELHTARFTDRVPICTKYVFSLYYIAVNDPISNWLSVSKVTSYEPKSRNFLFTRDVAPRRASNHGPIHGNYGNK